ncbi:MAG TPA: hypothetical protein VFL13_06595 [Candidatus Baltobacteraceae bacterium]|nr:hypothetical protein [Candidatus Baltobacteraceae bacterium]
MPDYAAGGITAAPDGSVYANGYSGFVRYKAGAFTTYAYVAPPGSSIVGAADGVGTVALGPYSVIWSALYRGACCPPAGGAVGTYNPGLGSRYQTTAGTPNGDAFVTVAADPLNRTWVTHQTGKPCSAEHSDVYIINSSLNVVTHFAPLPVARLYAIAAGADGMMYVASALECHSGVSEIARINPSTLAVLNVVTLPAGSNVKQMVAGPDGNLWFTNYDMNTIGRLTPSGTVTQYTLPTPGSQPNGITVGGDGALWFTEAISPNGELKIGRITTGGLISEYFVVYTGPGFAAGAGITGGPPGAPFANTLYVVALDYPYLYKLTF